MTPGACLRLAAAWIAVSAIGLARPQEGPAPTLATLEAELPELRRDLRQSEALGRLEPLLVGLEGEAATRAARHVATLTAERDLIQKAGDVDALRRLAPDALVARLAAVDTDARAKLGLARFAFFLGRREEGERALGEARDGNADLKDETDLVLAEARGEPVPRGGYHRYRGRWRTLEQHDRERSFDDAYERLAEVRPDGIALPFEPSTESTGLDRFERELGSDGPRVLRDAAAAIRAALKPSYDEVRGWFPSYAAQTGLRDNLLERLEPLIQLRQEALALIGRYDKPEQGQVDDYRRRLEALYKQYRTLVEIDWRPVTRLTPEVGDALLGRIRAREGALAAIDRYLRDHVGGGLEEVRVQSHPKARVTTRRFLPGREQSELEDVLWVAVHFAADRIVEVLHRTDDLLRRRGDLTVWEGLILDELRNRAIDRFNARVATSLDQKERQFVEVTNDYRKVLGLLPFEIEERLTTSARKHSREMVDLDYFGHISPLARNRTPTDRARLEGYQGGVGENCLAGSVDGRGAFEGWYRSPGHHRNLVSGGPHVGVGAARKHSMWTMVAGGTDLTWRALHADLGAVERRHLEALATRLADEAKAGAISPVTASAATRLLPAILPVVGRLALATTYDDTSTQHDAWPLLLRFITDADVGTEWRPLQIAAVAAAIDGLENEGSRDLRSAAFSLVRPLVESDHGYDEKSPRRRRHTAVLAIRREWEDRGWLRFRLGAAAVDDGSARAPDRIGDGPSLESPLKALTRKERSRLVRQHGGTAETEKAVERGLEWLADVQDADGGWRGRSFATVNPRFRGLDGNIGLGNNEWEVGLTGLSLLAFVTAGHTTTQGNHAATVQRGAQFLLERIVDYGRFETTSSHYMYNHAIATQALAELYAYSADPRLGVAAQLCVDYLMYAQHQESGGWRYLPNEAGDTSVTGWVILALNAAWKAGLDVGGFRSARRFLDSVTSSAYYRVGYTGTHDGGTVRLGAVGMLCRLFLDGDTTDPRVVLNAWRLETELPRVGAEDFYYWYYGTLAMFQLGDHFWQNWNAALLPALLPSQVTDTRSPLFGSWDPKGDWSDAGGRVYQTALGVLMLTTYYRYDRNLKPRVHNVTGVRDEEIAPYLAIITGDADEVVRAATTRKMIDKFGAASFPALLRLLRDRSARVELRRMIAQLIIECAEPQHEAALLKLLGEERDHDITEALVIALEEISTEASGPLLIEHLAHARREVRVHAAQTLARLGYAPAAPALSKRLEVEGDQWCQNVFRESLTRLGSRAAIATILDEVKPGAWPGRLRVLRALEILEDAGLGKRALGLRETEGPLYKRVVAAIGQDEEAAAIPVLLVMMESRDQDTRAEAVKLLRAITQAGQGYKPEDPEEQRRGAIVKWRRWWDERRRAWGAER